MQRKTRIGSSWPVGLLVLLSLLLAACGGQTSGGSGGGGGGSGGGGGGGGSPDFTIALSPTSLTVPQGTSRNTTLTLTPQNGFTGTVNLSLVDAGTNNPVTGITLSPTSFTVSASNPTNPTLTVNVAGSVATGSYSLKVKAVSGSINKEASLSLTVSAAGGGGGGPTQVTVRVSDPRGSGYTGYYLDSNQTSWQALNFSANQATFNVTGSRYGVAVVCSSASIQVYLLTVGESNQISLSCFPGGSPTGPLILVSVDASQISSAVAPGDEVVVNGVFSSPPTTLSSALRASVSYRKDTSGPTDLVVGIYQPSSSWPRSLKAIKVVRNVAASNPTVTFVPSDLTNAQSVSLTNLPPASFSRSAAYSYVTASNTGVGDVRVSDASYLPVAGFQSGDRYISFTEAIQGSYGTGSGNGQRVIAFKGHATPPTSAAFATPWPTGALSTNAASLPRVSGLSYSGAIAYGIFYSRGLSWLDTTVSSGYLAGATDFDFASLSSLLSTVGYTPPSNGSQASIQVEALVSPMGLRRSLDFISAFGSPAIFTSDLDIQLAGASRREYIVGGGTVTFP